MHAVFFIADDGVKKFWSLVVQHKRAQGGLANWESFDVLFTDGAVADERRYDFLMIVVRVPSSLL